MVSSSLLNISSIDISRCFDRKCSTAKKFCGINAPGVLLAVDAYALLEKQKYKCAECFEKLEKDFHLDHKMPLSRGGPNKIENLQGLCAPCNAAKHCADHLEWA